ncbi:NAD(P)(+) transhydrogenase (Re/Si-specific) subunit beta [Paraburkholderia susongensis]|uniref:NAD(P) transhydrogenase subunit beta n=1 Tax=Paraburkholderia susongensis TaxID=1515439 RepID=A0A1X7M790_9BURK|nr:NAD(P)(+) transhydrogenase (Re/Si-specific) subunit beta [Paraburkholderia susongensis]SMG61383.1 NAD(P) transhydrogenase subunit beta [Paraburkholderia susongensis]
MPQACERTVWMGVLFSLAVAVAAALVAVLMVALVALGHRQFKWHSGRRPYWCALALSAVLAGMFAAGLGASSMVVDAAMAGAVFGAWRVRECNLTRWPGLVALLGSGMGLAVVSGGIARYLSAAARENSERVELYAAVFIGALIFATSAIAFCKLRGALQSDAVARPGHHLVNLLAMLLCGWLGYGFVTEQAQPFGLAALLAMSALASAMGAHLMISREYSGSHAAANDDGCTLHVHAFAARSDGLSVIRRDLLSSIEWHGGEEQTWALRDVASGVVRASAYSHRRGLHDGRRAESRECVRECTRRRLVHFMTRP